MGYNTQHRLQIDPIDGHFLVPQCEHEVPNGVGFCPTCGRQVKMFNATDFVWDYIECTEDLDYMRFAVGSYGEGGDSCKWYDHKEDMYTISTKFPGMLFTLCGEGEEPGDLWVEFWVDGSVQVEEARITYGSFDPEKLTTFKPKKR